jgi:hypothetical protein
MHPLNITKVAVGCSSIAELGQRIEARASAGEVPIYTRYRPKRADELIGGSLYWIIRHSLAVRQRILGFADEEEGRRCVIRLEARLIPVRALPKRAHQGWRSLAAADAPADFEAGQADLAAMPAEMIRDLAVLGLI